MTMRSLVLVLLAAYAHAEDTPRAAASPVRAKPKARAEPQIRIGDPLASDCPSNRDAEKALDGRQVAALLAVQQHLLSEGFRFFARGLDSACFRSLDGYRFHVIPGSVVGVVVMESGACREVGFWRSDSQILYEWSGVEPLKHVLGEPGSVRAAELSRAAAAATRCPPRP